MASAEEMTTELGREDPPWTDATLHILVRSDARFNQCTS
jgi:hypothetical protein